MAALVSANVLLRATCSLRFLLLAGWKLGLRFCVALSKLHESGFGFRAWVSGLGLQGQDDKTLAVMVCCPQTTEPEQ